MWAPQIIHDASSYNDLITGKIPALVFPEILSNSQCDLLSEKILNISKSNKNSKKFGTSLSSHIYEKSKYFSNAQKSNKILKNLFLENESPLTIMKQKISKLFKKQIQTATENGMKYSDAMIRIHGSDDTVHLHRDNSNFEMSDYNVSLIKNQLSAILYLQSPVQGGDLSIFQKIWNRKDECMRDPDFGYSSDLIKGVNCRKITPISGNMVILNPNFYHQIDSISGKKLRVSLGFFFGEFSKDNLCSWS